MSDIEELAEWFRRNGPWPLGAYAQAQNLLASDWFANRVCAERAAAVADAQENRPTPCAGCASDCACSELAGYQQ